MIGCRGGGGDAARLQERPDGFDRDQHGALRASTSDSRRFDIHHARHGAAAVGNRRSGEPRLGRRLDTLTRPTANRARHVRGAGLRERIGNADQFEFRPVAVGSERRRDEVVRTVDVDEREIVRRLGGDALGMAKTGQ